MYDISHVYILTHPPQVSDARAETEALRRLLRLKARELKTLRRLGQEALLQRSEAEIFLISSLHMVSCRAAMN